jgi:hypothetical protein
MELPDIVNSWVRVLGPDPLLWTIRAQWYSNYIKVSVTEMFQLYFQIKVSFALFTLLSSSVLANGKEGLKIYEYQLCADILL